MSRVVPLTLLVSLLLSMPADALAKRRRARHWVETAPAREARGYYTPYLTGPGGERAPIMEVPGSAVVINKQILDDQQATTLGQALQNVSGVTVRH
jgi:outer membrane receptor for ferric coprogen and ferric-rhodotorulic acid